MNPKKIKFESKKLKEAILFLLSQSSNHTIEGKKKLAKLLYFADFNSFEAFEKPITGATYRALPMGPVPDELDDALKELRGKSVSILQKDIGLPNDMMVFSLKKDEDDLSLKTLSDEDRRVLRKVYADYGNLSGTDLENITHTEAPYNAVTQGEHIPYELSFYRDKTKKELVGT